jgi:hypothetical protein
MRNESCPLWVVPCGGVYPVQQLRPHLDGFDHVIVRAQPQRFGADSLVEDRGEHDYLDLLVVRSGGEPAEEFQAVHVGHEMIEKDQPGREILQVIQSVLSAGHGVRPIARLLQELFDDAGGVDAVVDDQDHTASLRSSGKLPQGSFRFPAKYADVQGMLALSIRQPYAELRRAGDQDGGASQPVRVPVVVFHEGR